MASYSYLPTSESPQVAVEAPSNEIAATSNAAALESISDLGGMYGGSLLQDLLDGGWSGVEPSGPDNGWDGGERDTGNDRGGERDTGNDRGPGGDTPLLDQRDNDFVNGASGDAQCQTTAITMVLIAKMGEQAVIDRSKELAAPMPSQYEQPEEMVDYVAQIRGISQTGGATTSQLFELYLGKAGVKVEDCSWQEWSSNREKLEVPTSTPFVCSTDSTSSGHVVTAVAVLSDGVIINDPYGVNLGQRDNYVRHQESAAGQNVPEWRFRFNDRLRRAFAAGETRSDWGESNFYTWDEVEGPLNIGKWVHDNDKGIDDVRA